MFSMNSLGERRKVLNWLLSYNPLWLRIGLEVFFSQFLFIFSPVPVGSFVISLILLILRQSSGSSSRWRATATFWVWRCSSSIGSCGTQTSRQSSGTPRCPICTKMVIQGFPCSSGIHYSLQVLKACVRLWWLRSRGGAVTLHSEEAAAAGLLSGPSQRVTPDRAQPLSVLLGCRVQGGSKTSAASNTPLNDSSVLRWPK